MTNELEELYSRKAAILTAQQYRLCKFQEIVVRTVQSVLSSTQSSGDAELLVARSALEETLRDRERHPMILEPKVQVILKLIFHHSRKRLQDLLEALSKEFSVVDGLTCAENTSAEGRRLFNICSGWKDSFEPLVPPE